MPRTHYITIRADYADPEPVHTTATVHELDGAPIRTGLLDANGAPLYRVPERHPIGFDMNGAYSAHHGAASS